MDKALQGIKILDFTRVYSGPYCTMLFADLGARIIKIEAVGKGDDTRYFNPIVNGESGYYNYLNRGKHSIALNLKAPEAKKIALKLAAEADIVIENFSPGTMARLGLDYDDIKAINPEVIYASISGFGHTGPKSHRLAYDSIIQFASGIASLTGYPDRPPTKTGPAISDAVTGVHAAVAILAAVVYKQSTGKGQYLDISMLDSTFSVLENAVALKSFLGDEPKRCGNSNLVCSPVNVYKARDGYVAVHVANNDIFKRFAKAMGRPELTDDPRFCDNDTRKRNDKQMDALVEEWTILHGAEELEELLDKERVPATRIKTVSEAMEDPQLVERGMVIDQEIPGVGMIRLPGCPLKLSATPPDTSRRAPMLGEDSIKVLKSLGYTGKQIMAMDEEGVIGICKKNEGD